MADIIIEQIFRKNHFSWISGNQISEGDSRSSYLDAVKAADRGDFSLLRVSPGYENSGSFSNEL